MLRSNTGAPYLPFLRQPVLVYQAGPPPELRRAFRRAKERGVHVGIYTEPLFATKGEAENVRHHPLCRRVSTAGGPGFVRRGQAGE